MDLKVVAYYLWHASIIGLSLFFGLQFMFASDYRREAWRSSVKHHLYVSFPTFKRLTLIGGWLFFLVFLTESYLQILLFV